MEKFDVKDTIAIAISYLFNGFNNQKDDNVYDMLCSLLDTLWRVLPNIDPNSEIAVLRLLVLLEHSNYNSGRILKLIDLVKGRVIEKIEKEVGDYERHKLHNDIFQRDYRLVFQNSNT